MLLEFFSAYGKMCDHIGFALAGAGTFGALAVSALTRQELVNDSIGNLLAVTSNLREWWLKNETRKNCALWLIDKGIPWFLLLAFIGFMLQIPQRFL